jgi:multidrug resistance efflux pump
VVAVEVDSPSEQQQRAVMQLLQWGSSWLEFLLRREGSSVSSELMTVVGILATGLEHESFQAAATATATELASCLSCERVSIGFRDGRHVRLRAISSSAKFGKKTNLVRDIELAMDEALDQESTIVYPPLADGQIQVTNSHAELSRKHDVAAICTIPLGHDGALYGALTFELRGEQTFDAPTIELCEVVSSLLGPTLELKRKEDRWLGAKIKDAGGGFLRRLFGPRHPGLKLAVTLLVGLGSFLSIATGDYRVSGKATLEGTVQRVVVAPIDGFIATASARPGDLVREGEMLGSLDDTDLNLEHLRWSSQREQFLNEYRKSLAEHDRTQTRILSARIAQAEAQIQLLDERLARTKFIAPFDGIVVAGDLSQKFGSPVERGQVLFEVAPLDSYRVIIEVDEQEISEVAVGQRGHLALSSLPGETMPFTVEKITPVSTAEEGRNFFRVEATLEAPSVHLRPGMQGVGKIEIEQRKLIWIWTYKLVNSLRLWAWSWWP